MDQKEVGLGVFHVCRQVRQAGGTAWLVGGCVRDALLGSCPKDIDFATNLKTDKLMKIFGKDATASTGKAFGTVTVKLGKSLFEITTLRREGKYSDGRRPDSVEYTDSIEEDLERRDFTINAIAYDPIEEKVVDPFNGLADLESGTLRVVGDQENQTSQRLREDGLRIWRAYRFLDDGQKATRTPTEDLEACLREGTSVEAAAQVSQERIWDETRKILRGFSAPYVLSRMVENGLLQLAFSLENEIEGRDDRRLAAQDHLLRCRRRIHQMFREIKGEPDKLVETYIALDLEATCNETNDIYPQEVIQLAATIFSIDPESRRIDFKDHFNTICRPKIHRSLSKFCTNLTGITQEDTNKSPSFCAVLRKFQTWLENHDLVEAQDGGHLKEGATILTCGFWDLGHLVPEQCKCYKMPIPPSLTLYSDVQNVFTNYYWSNSNSLKTMASKLGITREGQAHNAANDCRELAKVIHALYLDGCTSFPAQRYDAKMGLNEKGESQHMPRVDVARAALLLHGAHPDKVSKWSNKIGIDRNDKLLIKSSLRAFHVFPKTASLAEMAAYKHFVGPRLRFCLCLQASLVCGEYGWQSKEYLAFEEIAQKIIEMKDVQPLVDGGWIMKQTGLEKGVKLGRLKEWLWKLQIERSATTLQEMEKILLDIDWENSDMETWPRFGKVSI